MSFSPYSSGLQAFSPMYNMPGTSSPLGGVGTFPAATASPAGMPLLNAGISNASTGDKFTFIDKKITEPFKPDMQLHHFSELTPDDIRKNCGDIRGVAFDIDDTLSKFKLGNRSIPQELKDHMKELQASGMKLGIVSNNPNKKTAEKFRDELKAGGINVEVIVHADKPSPKGVEMMQQKFGLQPNQMLMVGDQTTDVESGKRAGVKTAQVDWFGNSKAHQKLMHMADQALLKVDKTKATFDSDPDQPEFLPDKPAISTAPIAAAAG